MSALEQTLRTHIQGDIHFDAVTRQVYSVDASIFEVEPLGIVIPKTTEDLIKTVRIANGFRIPLTVRGAATGITGGCLGTGLIIDTSKYLNRILEINFEQGYAICEPGVVQDDLNHQLAIRGYRLGPDTSTGNRATLGGMLANNAAGSRSLRYGRMVDHVEAVDIVLANGDLLHFESILEEEWDRKRQADDAEGRIYRTLWQIKNNYAAEIQKHFPKIPRAVSGYNLDELIKPGPLNVAKLIVGSEGTLGIVTRLKVRIVPKARATGLCLLHIESLIPSMQAIPMMLSYDPSALEMIDDQIIELGRAVPSMQRRMEWLKGTPKAIFIAEFDGQNSEEVEQKVNRFAQDMQAKQIGTAQTIILKPDQMNDVWTLRKAGLGILLSKRSYSRAIAFLEDLSIAPERLAEFMERFTAYLRSKGKAAGIYGHIGSGCMHIRPYINLQDSHEFQLMQQMMEDISTLILEYQGSLSGEHGDGLIRSWLNPKMFGPQIMQAFAELKDSFDPDHLMNPGKIVFSNAFPKDQLRLSPNEVLKTPKTFLNFQREGGFDLAVDLCNGNGLCRKKEGVMCPSFQVTNDEFHSTRARAQALRSIIHGHLPMKDLTSQGLHDVMDLCIMCKGCRTECPSLVDMSKMKAEFLYHYQKKHSTPLRNYLFGYIGKLSQWMSWLPRFFNTLQSHRLTKVFLYRLGITEKRTLPSLARQTFSKWFSTYQQPSDLSKEILLFNDTFNEFHHPEVGHAAVKLLNALGYKALVLPWTCCGRPLLSKGLLEPAQKYAQTLIETLLPYASKRIPIIGLEPSCLLTIKDDYQGLIKAEDSLYQAIETIVPLCFTLDSFLADLIHQGQFKLNFKDEKRHVMVHGHCHEKALVGMKPTLQVLRSVPGFEVHEIHSGCCGMAGSFGYEAEHYDISMRMGDLRLFPAIRQASKETLIVANGTSCRSQIKDGVNRQSVHLAEALVNHLKN